MRRRGPGYGRGGCASGAGGYRNAVATASRPAYTGPMGRPALTDAIQDYLKEIYKLGSDGSRVSVTALAKRQRVAPASASAMVKKLAALGLAGHQPYRRITPTTAGE